MKAAGKDFSRENQFLNFLNLAPLAVSVWKRDTEKGSGVGSHRFGSAHPAAAPAPRWQSPPHLSAEWERIPLDYGFVQSCAALPSCHKQLGGIPIVATFPAPESLWGCAWIPAPPLLRAQPCIAASHHHLLPQRAHSGSPTVLTQLKCSKKPVLAVLLSACCAPSRDTTLGHPYHRACVQPSFSFSPWEAEKSEF